MRMQPTKTKKFANLIALALLFVAFFPINFLMLLATIDYASATATFLISLYTTNGTLRGICHISKTKTFKFLNMIKFSLLKKKICNYKGFNENIICLRNHCCRNKENEERTLFKFEPNLYT